MTVVRSQDISEFKDKRSSLKRSKQSYESLREASSEKNKELGNRLKMV